MLFLAASGLVAAHAFHSLVNGKVSGVKCSVVTKGYLTADIVKVDSAHSAYGVREEFIANALGDTQCLEYLGALIGLDSGDTHF